MILGNFRLPFARTPHASKAVAVAVTCLVLAAIGCETSRRTSPTTFTTHPQSSDGTAQQIGPLQTTQNPVPIDPRIHVHGPNNTYAFGQQFVPTSVIDPKQNGDSQRGSGSGLRGFSAGAGSGAGSGSGDGDGDGDGDGNGDGDGAGAGAGDGAGDGDGIGVGDDGFPNDPLRNTPRMYGYGRADRDSDNGTVVEALLCSSSHFVQVCASNQDTVSTITNTSTSITSSQVKP